jgi:hypothetical protein
VQRCFAGPRLEAEQPQNLIAKPVQHKDRRNQDQMKERQRSDDPESGRFASL